MNSHSHCGFSIHVVDDVGLDFSLNDVELEFIFNHSICTMHTNTGTYTDTVLFIIVIILSLFSISQLHFETLYHTRIIITCRLLYVNAIL